ncbi:MAG: ATP-binding protein [Bacteroidales bacterium]|nr:ATP-binding protein [Bacteroidales bacterium]
MEYFPRKISEAVADAVRYFSVIVITGPRQSGKSTLCNHLFEHYRHFNMEDIGLRQAVKTDPKGFLDSCGKEVVIDEVQHVPDLLSYVQLVVDADDSRRFVLTGSSNFALLESVTQSLAGRAALFTLLPFSIDEVSGRKLLPTDRLLVEGLYPGVVAKGIPHELFYRNYYSTYIERDVRRLSGITNLDAFQHFIRLAAARCGNEFNASSLAVEVGVSSPTIKSWLGILKASFIAFSLQPYHTNISKRLAKTPKIYFYDTGLLCWLIGINTPQQLSCHPLRGAIFENFAVVELLKMQLNADSFAQMCFYRENSGREVDVMIANGIKYDIFEIKSAKTFNPDFLKNINYLSALLEDKIARKTVVYDGDAIPPNVINIRDIATLANSKE